MMFDARQALKADLRVNRGDLKACFVMIMFRCCGEFCSSTRIPRFVRKIVNLAYRILVDWIMTVEIPLGTVIGPGFRIHHAQGIVVNERAVIGSNVSMHQGVTLGGRRSGVDCPIIMDGVRIGSGAIVLGAVTIGRGAAIGAGAVVLSDVPAGRSAVGNPARVLYDDSRR